MILFIGKHSENLSTGTYYYLLQRFTFSHAHELDINLTKSNNTD